MSTTDQLAWEQRLSRPAAAAAWLAAVLLIAGNVYLQASLDERPDTTDELLAVIDAQSTEFIVAGVIQSLGLLLLVPVFLYLYRATKHRRPETSPFTLILIVLGPLVAAALGIARQVELVAAAGDFALPQGVTGEQAEQRAEDFLDESEGLQLIGGIGFVGNVMLGVGVLLLSLNAMRAGLTSRFLGIIGIIVGVLYVLPVAGGPQVVQLFWLGALGALFLGRWPGGRGPAWESGEAEPWPSAADQAQRRVEERAGTPAGDGRGAGAEEEAEAPSRAPSRKRKRRG